MTDVHLATTPVDDTPVTADTSTDLTGGIDTTPVEENPAYAPPSENGSYDPYETCSKPANYNRSIVHVVEHRNEYQPVAEIHTSRAMKANYKHGEKASSSLGVGYKHADKWSLSGAVAIENDSESEAEIPTIGERIGRHINGQFHFVRERITACGSSCCRADDPQPYVYFRIRALEWTGGLQFDTTDLSGWDTRENFDKAAREGRVTALYRSQTFSRKSGKTHRYTLEAKAFGVQLSAQSSFSSSTYIKWHAASSHLFGNNGNAKTASIVYAYD